MINAIVCKFSKLCFGLQFTLIAFLFHFPQRCPSQLASLFSLKFLSLLRELASLISAPISSLCSWLHDHQACHFCLHVAPGNVVLWSQEMREGPGSNTFLMGLWSELKDELKVLNTVTARWHLIPFSLQGCSPTHFPSHAFPIQGFADGLPLPETQCLLFILAALSQVPCTSPLQPKLLCIMHFFMIVLWLLPPLSDYMSWGLWWAAQICLRIKGYYCPCCWKCNLFGPESTEEKCPVPPPPPHCP